jgi:solute carrier family 38 (sodium-coupled neutral amino acid transporter), member 2
MVLLATGLFGFLLFGND